MKSCDCPRMNPRERERDEAGNGRAGTAELGRLSHSKSQRIEANKEPVETSALRPNNSLSGPATASGVGYAGGVGWNRKDER